jgi:endonuclease VIII
VHLKMEGRVFVERPRSSFYKPRTGTPEMRLAVDDGGAIVGRRLPVCRLLTTSQERRDGDLGGLGPDLLAATPWDEKEVLRRARKLESFPRASGAKWEVAEALLVQRIAAGIGNVYKSEVLFLEGVHPRALVRDLDDDTILRLYRRASILLKRNIANGPRTTRPTLGGSRKWVYERGNKPCFRCGTAIVRFMQGPEGGRSTYYCPRCQPPVAAAAQTDCREKAKSASSA